VSSEQQGDGDAWEPLDTAVTIETPEHVRFRYMLAGPSRRLAAYALDTLVRGLVFAFFAIAGGLGRVGAGATLGGFTTGALFLIAFVIEWAYFVLFETLWNGQSPGKRWLGLRVVNASGRPLAFVDSVLRNVLRAADFLPAFYALGGAISAFDPRFRRLGDFVGGTLVIAEDRRAVDALLPRLPEPSPQELASLPASVVLLPSEVQAVELYLRRRPWLSNERSEELAELAIETIGKRLRLPRRSPSRLLEILYLRAHGGSRAVS
jgi:uncharacterized RDD family membrane protein YckC